MAITDDNPESVKAKAKQEEQYQVAGLGEEDVTMTTGNLLRLIPQQDTMSFDNIESRMTSVSIKDGKKIAGASLTTVLSQALQAED